MLISIYKNDNLEYCRLALKSIYEDQTLKPDEIVLVFDGPLSSELMEVIEEFKANKSEIVKIVPLKKNVGLGEALRIGSQNCRYEYIMRMDTDDISAPKRFEKQIAYLNKEPNVDVLGSNIAEFRDDPSKVIRHRDVPKLNFDIVKMAKKRNPMNHMTVCIKRDSLIKCGGYETLLLLEDYYLWLKFMINGMCLENLQENLVYVRLGDGFEEKRSSKLRVVGWKKLQEVMLEHHLISEFQAIRNMMYIRIFVYMPTFLKKILYDSLLRNG